MFADPEGSLRGVVTRASLESVIAHYQAQQWRADRAIVTGDLIQDDSAEAYSEFRELLLPLKLRIHCVPGNHDIPDLMQAVCHVPPFSYCAYEEVNDWLIAGIDSTLDDSASGHVPESELERLAEIVSASAAPHVMVCLHHPPVSIDSKGLDSVGLQNADEVLAFLQSLGRVRLAVFGHVHQEFDRQIDGLRLLATPSTCRQFKPQSDNFEVDERPPAYRRITLHADGSCASEVVWVTP